MGHRLAFQEAVDHITEGRVHAGCRPRMGPPQTEWKSNQLHLWGGGGRFHVLADPETPFRLVPRTGLRLQFCRRSPAIHRYERWSPHWNSVIVIEHEPIVTRRHQPKALSEPYGRGSSEFWVDCRQLGHNLFVCGFWLGTLVRFRDFQYSRKSTSTVIQTGTGFPSFFAGLNLYLRTASSAFSSSPMPSDRVTRALRGLPCASTITATRQTP